MEPVSLARTDFSFCVSLLKRCAGSSKESQQTTTHLFVEKSYLSKRQEGAVSIGAMKGTSSTAKLEVELVLNG